MATAQEILTAARELGKMISTHQAVTKFQDVLKRLSDDVQAQRTFNDYQRHLQTIAQKEVEGKPIEVADKRKLEQLQKQVIGTQLLQEFQIAQMDYSDLMRQVDGAIADQADPTTTVGGTGAPMAASGLTNPNMAEPIDPAAS